MVRVFIAIDIEDPLILSRIERIKESLISIGTPMKPVESHNLHVTLRFIGEVPPSTVEEIKRSILGRLEFRSFSIRLQGLGAFPSPTSPRVVWVGVEGGLEELSEIRRFIDSGLRSLGIPPDRQEFKPHVTLARVKGRRRIEALSKAIIEYSDYEFGEMVVSSVRLKKSTLTREGPIYETLLEVKAVDVREGSRRGGSP